MEDVKSVRAASSLWAKTVLVRRKSSTLLDGFTKFLRNVSVHPHVDSTQRRLAYARTDGMEAAEASGLASLPLDALLVVFSYLDVVDVLSVAQVCPKS